MTTDPSPRAPRKFEQLTELAEELAAISPEDRGAVVREYAAQGWASERDLERALEMLT